MPESNPDRLPSHVIPFHYDVVIKTDVERETFEGKAAIHLEVVEESNTICLNSHKDLELLGIVLRRSGKDSVPFLVVDKDQATEPTKAYAYLEDHDRLVLRLPPRDKLIAGERGLQLYMSWSSKLRTDGRGYYMSNYGSPVNGKHKHFALTHLEPASARQVYPCWDEPAIKASFAFTMVTLNGLKCLSCMPETTSPRALQSQLAMDLVEAGWQVVHFETTPSMYTYITAFASGPLSCIDDRFISPLTGKVITVATWATEDDCKHTAFALRTMKNSLAYFENLLQIPYPLPKLDLLAVPRFEAGGMENFGLIVIRARDGLTPPGASLNLFIQVVDMICHEVSHMWFGNLVTPAWWDDLFLKEGFASWLGGLKCGDQLYPELCINQSVVAQTFMSGLASDSTRHTHPLIDEKAQTLEQLQDNYDDIRYFKSSSVVSMMASYAGMERFIIGLQRFLGNGCSVATREDLWRAMDDGNGDFVSFARKWISTEGYPVIKLEKSEKGFTLRQERFLCTGDLKAEEDTEIWLIPLNIHLMGESQEVPKLFSTKTMELDVAVGSVFKLNRGSFGLYRVCYSEEMIGQLSGLVAKQASSLSAEDRIGLLDDCFQLAHAGYYPPTVPLNFALAMKEENEAWVLFRLHSVLSSYLGRWCLHDRVSQSIKGLLRFLFSRTASKLGFDSRGDDTPLDPLARQVCVAGALLGDDKHTVSKAIERFDSAISKDSLEAIPKDILRAILSKAVEVRGQTAVEVLKNFYLASCDDRTRQVIAIGMCSVSSTEAEIVETLTWMLNNGRNQHLESAVESASKGVLGDSVSIPWFIDHFKDIESKVSRYTLRLIMNNCLKHAKREETIGNIEGFFASSEYGLLYETDVAKALEHARAEIAVNRRDFPQVLQWFAEKDYFDAE